MCVLSHGFAARSKLEATCAIRSGGEANGERVRRSEEAADDARAGGFGVEAKVVQPLEYRVERETALHAGEVHTEAHVRTGSERQVRLRRSMDVEAVRLRVVVLVAVGGREEDVESSSCGDVDAVELTVTEPLRCCQPQRRVTPLAIYE